MWEVLRDLSQGCGEALLADGDAECACVGWGGRRHSGEVRIGGGVREWNVEFILLGAQLRILIFSVSCSSFLILGLNPDSTSSSVAELQKADTVGYSWHPAHYLSSPLLQAAKRDKERAAPPPPQRKTCCPLQIHPCARPWVSGS